MTVVILLGQLLLFGLDYIIIKHMPRLLRSENHGNAKFFLTSIAKFIFYIFVAWEIFALLVNQSVHNLMFDRILYDSIHPAYFYLACAGIFAFYTFALKTLRALSYKVLYAILYYAASWILVGFLLVMPITLNNAVLGTMASFLVVTIFAFGVIFLFFMNVSSRRFIFPENILKDAFHFTAQQIFSFQSTGILLILMEVLPIPEGTVGVFSATVMIANLSFIITNSMKNVFLEPIINAMHGEKRQLEKVLHKVSIIATISILLVGIFLYFLTPALLHLYGIKFNAVKHFILFALIANIPGAVVTGEIMFINYFNEHTNKIFTYLVIFKLFLAVGVGTVLINYFDLYGAMVAYIIVEFIFSVTVLRFRQIVLKKIDN
jgi:hypothetical protein